jgi:hypothetical protein
MEPAVVISLLLNAITVMLVVWLVYRGDKTVSEFKPHVSEIAKIKEDLLSQSAAAISQSVEAAKQIVRTTQANADQTLKTTNEILRQLQTEVTNKVNQTISEEKLSLQKGTEESLAEYRKNLLSLLSEQQQSSKQFQDQLLNLSKEKMEEIARVAPEGVLNLHQAFDQQIKEKLLEAEKEIASYKSRQLQRVDEKIYQLVAEIAKKTIGRSIDVSTHEEIVMEALQKARKEKVL